ncbi:hypothetical protein PUNSTDRAFT_132235 [Punctularia strigosozonata HHB-11173 SS5]|uniref:uncharacterized protein n=1 Tax=Punctularia strigosozonata (strain HHB-11173) TaxID=741275 RepID=UPI0004417FA6|nr:uncharacterized protein PUNSTDRAFT_132235 [Punctularia strigosozonata HHB-11173 SS5]EIN10126.1 hypothetical protein PUNSTDRAFT_132235 [Punctularia strigosozonata HHB-11173 SS5]
MSDPSSIELDSEPLLGAAGARPVAMSHRQVKSEFFGATALAACVFCTIISIGLVFIPSRSFDGTPGRGSGVPLPRPNQYIGFELINRSVLNETPPDPIVNQASFIQQINRARPKEVMYMGPSEQFTKIGSLSVLDRRILVNTENSTVVQYHAGDYGMENCQLIVDICQTPHPAGVHPEPDRSTLPTSVVDVWRLDYASAYPLDSTSLTWRSRPRRIGDVPLASMTFSENCTAATPIFRCPSDTMQSFEITCATPDCHLDFWQTGRDQSPAAYMMQFSSL